MTLATGTQTDPSEAAHFVSETAVDLLAVSIGNVHGQALADAKLDLERLMQIRRAVVVPLVLHGASGVEASQVAAAVDRGIAKINLGTGRGERPSIKGCVVPSRRGRWGPRRWMRRRSRYGATPPNS